MLQARFMEYPGVWLTTWHWCPTTNASHLCANSSERWLRIKGCQKLTYQITFWPRDFARNFSCLMSLMSNVFLVTVVTVLHFFVVSYKLWLTGIFLISAGWRNPGVLPLRDSTSGLTCDERLQAECYGGRWASGLAPFDYRSLFSGAHGQSHFQQEGFSRMGGPVAQDFFHFHCATFLCVLCQQVDIEPTPGRIVALKPKVTLTCSVRVPANSWLNLSAVWQVDAVDPGALDVICFPDLGHWSAKHIKHLKHRCQILDSRLFVIQTCSFRNSLAIRSVSKFLLPSSNSICADTLLSDRSILLAVQGINYEPFAVYSSTDAEKTIEWSHLSVCILWLMNGPAETTSRIGLPPST